MKELVLGCGNYKKKRIFYDGNREYDNSLFLDIDPGCKPDLIYDLNQLGTAGNKLPFEDNEFDEIHAYDVLEHVGRQGDVQGFFREFAEYYRILKDKGRFFISCPKFDGKWAWGDPGHTRMITKETITYLSQEAYDDQVGITQISDYRYMWKGNFKVIEYYPGTMNDSDGFTLECIK